MDLTLQKLREMFAGAASDISANEQYLCSLDSVCGDGDHGVAIRGAICAASDALKSASNLKDALYDAGINIRMISTSEIKMSVLIDAEYADKAVRAVHDAFIS